MYEDFARVYDEFMTTIPYTDWADYAEKLFQHHGVKPKLVLDLCCGTGSLTLEMAQRGYDMIGVDGSFEMLDEARQKTLEAGKGEDILYLLQDMREFELYGTVQSILCTCDSLNYLLDEEDLRTVFRLAENYLENDGLLMFDMNTEYKYKTLLADNTFADTTEDAAFIWQNYYYEEEKVNEYDLTLFLRGEDGSYQRKEETHLQKAYDKEAVIKMLEEAHLKVEGVYDAFTLEEAREDSERITFVARQYRPKRTE